MAASRSIESASADEPGVKESAEKFYGGVVYQSTRRAPSSVCVRSGPSTFESTRTGLDHVSFAVDSRDELVRVEAELSEAGIAHGEVIDLTDAGLAILSFQDPDDINIELTAPLE